MRTWYQDALSCVAFIILILLVVHVVYTTAVAKAQEDMVTAWTGETVIETRTEIVEKTISASIPQIVDGIHLLESSRGKAKVGLQAICEAQGKSNEYGYGGMAMKKCFDSHEEATKHVAWWVARHLDEFDGSVGKTLCYYNLGEKVETCQYYQNYKKAIENN
jgi:hypothetical protein